MRDLPSYEFGPFRLIPAERLLLRGDEPIALMPKAFDTLVALVHRAGRLADKEELLHEVWPDAFVEEANLTQNVFALRRALGTADDGKPYIETVPKRGYRFVARVEVIAGDVAAPDAAAPGLAPTPALPIPAAEVPVGTLTTAPSPEMRPARRIERALAIAAVAAALVLTVMLFREWRKPRPASAEMTMTRLTTIGRVVNVAISPDGKYVAYAVRENANQSLWVRQAATQSVVQIVPPAPGGYVGLTFTPDGNHIFYNLSSGGTARRTLYEVPTLGGTPRRVMENLRGGAVSFSPDGRQFAFVRVTRGEQSALMVAAIDGSAARALVSLRNPPDEIDAPAWSPDGNRIAYAVTSRDRNDTGIFEVSVAGGSVRPLTDRRWLRIIKAAWVNDGSSLILLATAGESFTYQIWQLSYPDGTATRITNDLNSYGSMSVAAAANAIAAVLSDTEANIWVAPDNDAARIRAVTTGSGKADAAAAWTPDGRIVYHSNVSGAHDIWIVSAAGGNPQQLTRDARINQGPAVSPDGRQIVFMSDRAGVPHLWRMSVDGSDQRQLTNGPDGEQNPQFSPDGRWIVYRTSSGKATVWKVPAAGGEPRRLTDTLSFVPSVSPDGRWLAYVYQDDDAPPRIAVAPFEGEGPVRTFPFSAAPLLPRLLRWTRDSRGLAYVAAENEGSNIVAQPLDGGEPVRLTNFTSGRIFSFAWSADGRQLAVSRGAVRSDVVLIRNFR